MFLTSKVTTEFWKTVQSKINLCDWDIPKANIAKLGWGGGSIFFFTAWDGSEGSIQGVDVALTQFFNHFSYMSYSKQLTLILLRFVQYVLCKCIYVCACVCPLYVCNAWTYVCTGKWRPEIKVRFYFSGALHPISRHCLSLGLELTKLGRLDGLPKAQRTLLSASSALGFQASTTTHGFLYGL